MDSYHKIITKSAQETAETGAQIARDLTRGAHARPHIFCLYGDLGSGKTTFTQGFAKALGITSRLLSPTFIIVRRYDILSSGATEKFLYHIDLYRMKNMADMEELGLTEIFMDPGSIVVVEWAEKLTENLPEDRTDIWFSVDQEGKHHITVKTNII